MSGKGSSPRPFSVDHNTFSSNWDKIFKRPDPRVVQDAENEDAEWKYLEKLNKQRQEQESKE